MPNSRQFIIYFLFRSRKNQAYSIEELFEGVERQLTQTEFPKARIQYRSAYVPEPSNTFSNILRNIRFARSLKCDLVHITGDIHYVLPFLPRKVKKVVTIHDLVSLKRVSRMSIKHWIYYFFWYVLPVRFADAITVISDKTGKDLVSATPAAAEKTTLVPNYVQPIFKWRPKTINTEQPNLLLIGGADNKNVARSIAAIKQIAGAQVTLLGAFPTQVFDTLNAEGIPFSHHVNITHTAVAELYATADIVLFPSLYEGFGMPIIEGQATGRPVITSDRSPMKEVAGNGACLVDPESIDSITSAIKRVLSDESYRDNLISEGKENAKRFDINTVTKSYRLVHYALLQSL